MVITDGSDTTGSNMNNVVETVIEAGAVVSIIALSNGDNRGLEQLAILTGRKCCFIYLFIHRCLKFKKL